MHIRAFDQLAHALKGHGRGVFNFLRHHLHAHHQAAQFLYHIIEGVGQHTQGISRHLRLHAQITFTNAAHLADQLLHLRLQRVALRLRFLDQVDDVVQHIVHSGCHFSDFVAAGNLSAGAGITFSNTPRQHRQPA